MMALLSYFLQGPELSLGIFLEIQTQLKKRNERESQQYDNKTTVCNH